MREPIELHLNEAPKLHSPILIAGLPDSGRVAKIVLDHLVKTLKALPLGYLHSDYLPPRVLLKPDGTPELMKHEFYYWVNTDETSHDLVLYTGDAQPILPEGAFRLRGRRRPCGTTRRWHLDHCRSLHHWKNLRQSQSLRGRQ